MKRILTKTVSVILLALMLLPSLFSCSEQRVYYVELNVKDMGRIVLELDAKAAPKTVAHFVGLVEDGFYDGLTFNRADPSFVLQGGDGGTASNGISLFGEFDVNGHMNPIAHRRGVISMARSTGYNSASTQFFICLTNSESCAALDGQYAAFGYVAEGMDVVDRIVGKTSGYGDPNNMYFISDTTKQAVIESARVLTDYAN